MTRPTLKDKLAALPDAPGVYLFKDAHGTVIYVGKAKSLRDRVRTYFTARDDGRYQYPRLVAAIRDLEVILTRDEVEALKTEAALVRKHKPRYNVDLKDDKSYPYLKVTREPFPRVLLTRKPQEPPAGDIYGPYTDVRNTRWLLRTLKGIFQIRDCSLALTEPGIARGKFKVCLDFHLGRCGGPCEGKVERSRYLKGVTDFVRFLQGHHEDILESLESEMRALAGQMRFEEAAAVRDRLRAAQRFSQRQVRVEPTAVNRDAVGMAREDDWAIFSVVQVRGGRIVGRAPFHIDRSADLSDSELMEAFLMRHYDRTDSVPPEVFLSSPISDPDPLAAYLSAKSGRAVRILTPQRGEKRHLVDIAVANAEQLLLERRLAAERRDFVPRSVKALQHALRLPSPPRHIEAFDVSHLHGLDSVAAMVAFRDGKPFKSGYRLFKIKTFTGVDDFAAIGEAVTRRYRRVLSESACPALPDLILIDGGAGQLSAARRALEQLNLELPVLGLAKRLEEIHLPDHPEPLTLPRTSSALQLLQQIRDEAHRFAVTRHRLLRGKRQVRSRLDDIPGIGPQRRQELLKAFGSVRRIAAATPEELARVRGMNARLAKAVLDGLAQS